MALIEDNKLMHHKNNSYYCLCMQIKINAFVRHKEDILRIMIYVTCFNNLDDE